MAADEVSPERSPEKKERVIHTRVSASLQEELKSRASGLGISVSNLVRNVLVNTFDLVEDVLADSASIRRAATGTGGPEPSAPKGSSASPILGWQKIVLNLNALCLVCNAICPKGSEAALGLRSGGEASSEILCLTCLEERRHESK